MLPDSLSSRRTTRAGRLLASLVTTVALAAGLIGTAAFTSTASAAGSAPAVGVNFKGMWSDMNDTQRADILDKMAAAHMSSVRLDVGWTMLQPDGPDTFSAWGVSFVDRVIGMANARGIKPLVMLWLTPGWANGGRSDRTPPTNPADYARIAEWAAHRYAGKVVGWEVWNEPNSDTFWVGSDAAAYARLMQAAYPAFHRGDPGAMVLTGGLMYNDTDWLARAYAGGLHGNFDGIATHPYMGVANSAPETPDDGTEWTLMHAAAVHQLMVNHGDGTKPIWFTEIGWSTHATAPGAGNWELGVSEATQADYSVRMVKAVTAKLPYVKRVYFYTERDQATGGTQEDHYGLLYRDGTPKPSYLALKAYLSTVAPTPISVTAPVGHWRHGIATHVRLAPAFRARHSARRV